MDDFYHLLIDRNSPAVNEKLQAATVGIAGCGGLGSNVAVALARIGIGKLVLVDSDVVEASNLNRQYFFMGDLGKVKAFALADIIRQFNPKIELETHNAQIGPENLGDLFNDCSVIVEAFDTAEAKAMIMTEFADERFKDKYLVAASGLAGSHSSNLIQTSRLAGNIYLCGDQVSEPNRQDGLMAPRVMVAAGHQANMVVRILDGVGEP